MPSGKIKPISLEDEYDKHTEITPQDIAMLRQWLKTQPHLPEKHITDLDLILAYHCCNCSFELAKQVLDLNLTLRTIFTNYFKDRKFEASIEQSLNHILMTPLPIRTAEGYVIIYTHIINNDPKVFNFGIALRAFLMIIDSYQYEDGTWPGVQFVIDFEGFTLGHLTKMDLQNIQQSLYYVQEAILFKLKGMHFINAPSFIDKLLLMMKPFMKKGFMEIVQIHTTGSGTIEKFIPIEALPKEFGGTRIGYEEMRDYILTKLKNSDDYFEEDNLKRVTESLRPGKPKSITDIFGGVEGSFKKLNID